MDVLKDLLAGTVGGVSGTVIGHPLDTIKTRMQATSSPMRNLGTCECLSHMVQQEGWNALWRGIATPLVSQGLYQSLAFASYQWTLKQAIGAGTEESRANIIAGISSGIATSFVTTPMELIKISLQVEHGAIDGHLADMFRSGRSITQSYGIHALYRGLAATLIRDTPATAVYFVSYDSMKRACTQRIGGQDRWKETVAEMLAGGCAGSASWACALPGDCVKTLIQEAAAQGRRYGWLEAAQHIYHRDGTSGFLRGGFPLVLRGFPVNAITFAVYEHCKRLLG